MFCWYYVWTEAAGWKRIRQNAPLEHLRGEIPLPRCRDGFVRLGGIVGRSENRIPLEVASVEFLKHQADARGYMTEAQQHAHMASAMEALDPLVRPLANLFADPSHRQEPPGPTVIDAESRFTRRRYDAKHRWRPARETLEEFCRVVNSRAGTVLMVPR